MDRKRVTIPQLMEWKKNQRKISALTAYDYTFARLLDESGVDVILVGDSAGMVAMGHENTLPVTMDEMIFHTRGVRRGVQSALLVGDMPFMSYHVSEADTIQNAGRFIQEGGAEAVEQMLSPQVGVSTPDQDHPHHHLREHGLVALAVAVRAGEDRDAGRRG